MHSPPLQLLVEDLLGTVVALLALQGHHFHYEFPIFLFLPCDALDDILAGKYKSFGPPGDKLPAHSLVDTLFVPSCLDGLNEESG
ncbi:hypothetical protein BDY21DRAFT_344846 [Lineolata rhizophorae]|uniref:Uncharacterized protein n=1 Tax=Lineolata rhizophorae TaxID=578093 RepID=A0A6A6P0T3_9PEZI|nr:hypothetical protein BDY21DRAFT_344846 [Lineolata rhizophorae]